MLSLFLFRLKWLSRGRKLLFMSGLRAWRQWSIFRLGSVLGRILPQALPASDPLSDASYPFPTIPYHLSPIPQHSLSPVSHSPPFPITCLPFPTIPYPRSPIPHHSHSFFATTLTSAHGIATKHCLLFRIWCYLILLVNSRLTSALYISVDETLFLARATV